MSFQNYDAYILVKRTIVILGQGADTAAIAADINNKKRI